MENKKWIPSITFWITEVVLLLAATFFAFALVGYITLALTLIGIATIVLMYECLSALRISKPVAARVLTIALTAVLIMGGLLFAILEIPIVRAARTDTNPEAPYILILGAGVNGEEPSLSLLDRLEAALDYLEKYPESVAIASGGQGPGENITEAECMRRWLTSRGIPEKRIIMEDRASSTEENIAFSLNILKEMGEDTTGRLAIISSEYHLYRAKLMAKEAGAQPIGVAAVTRLPVLSINYFIREAIAVFYLKIT